MATTVQIRPYEAGDVSFIFSSWLKSYRGSPVVRSVPNTIYYAKHHEVIEKILSAAGTEVWVACHEDSPENILGYVVATHGNDSVIIHWVYSKQMVRMQGLAKRLIKKAIDGSHNPVSYTHYTKMVDILKGDAKASYNPYLLWE